MISVLISAGSRYPFARKKIRAKIKEFLQVSGLDDVEVSLSVVGTRKSQRLNQEYRDLDQQAPVLSFPLEEPRSPDGILRLGDVVVCYPLARQEAARGKRMVDEVIWELVEHGMSNLLGKQETTYKR